MANRIGTLAFNEACQIILKTCPNNYAKAYARAGLSMTDRNDIAVQAIYILSNTSHWHGDMSRVVKNTLREFASQKLDCKHEDVVCTRCLKDNTIFCNRCHEQVYHV